MKKYSHISKILRIIFSVLFVYLTLGDWHVHAAVSHHCEEEHTSIHSDFKWQSHEACENSEDNESHTDYKQALPSLKMVVHLEASSTIHTPIPLSIQQQPCQVCLMQVELNQRLLATTLLLI